MSEDNLKKPGSFEDLFERVERGRRERGVEPLSEEEAMRLANEELHAWRRERREARRYLERLQCGSARGGTGT